MLIAGCLLNISLVENRSSVLKEVKVLEKLHNRAIIKLKNAFLLESQLVIVMEYASGGELKAYVTKHKRLDEGEARRLFRQIVEAVHHCHMMGVIHRDLKLENVLFATEDHTDIKVVFPSSST
jgi:serine/threonine protein kinase